jgi:hypothetical protein
MRCDHLSDIATRQVPDRQNSPGETSSGRKPEHPGPRHTAGRSAPASGQAHRSLAPIPVRYMSVDTATRRRAALQGDTPQRTHNQHGDGMRAQRKASAWRSHQSPEGHGGCSGDVLPVWSVLACHRADPRRDVPALLDRRPDDAAPPAPAQHADQPGLRPGHPERPAERKPSIGGRGHGPVLPTHRHLPARNPGPPLTKCRPRGHGWLRRALARQAASAVPRTAPSAETAFLRFPVRRLTAPQPFHQAASRLRPAHRRPLQVPGDAPDPVLPGVGIPERDSNLTIDTGSGALEVRGRSSADN